jgi:hypothetical protein
MAIHAEPRMYIRGFCWIVALMAATSPAASSYQDALLRPIVVSNFIIRVSSLTRHSIRHSNFHRALAGDLRLDVGDLPVDFGVGFHVAVDGSHGVQHGGVIATTEVPTDFFQAVARARNMQTCRGNAMLLWRRLPCRSLCFTL